MNRQEWEEQVFNSDLNPTARMVCMAIGSHGNWTVDKEVRPSKQRIASMVGTSRQNVGKYIEALIKQGWLIHTRTLRNNVKVYELSTPLVGTSSDILSIRSRGRSVSEVVTTHYPVVTSSDKQVVTTHHLVVTSNDTNLKEPTIKNLQEEPTSNTPVPDGPVASSNIREERVHILNSGELRELDRLTRLYQVDECDSTLIKKMLQRGDAKHAASFSERVELLMNEIGIEVGEQW